MGKNRLISLTANVSGEMQVEDIPVAGWADTDALKKGDDDPLEVVMAVPAGKSTRGWNYTANALNSIVGEVNSKGLPGFLGHQKAENVATEFPSPVTHWIGAKMKDGVAYFRGLIDKSASDLKRWVRGKAITQVSIYGYPELTQNTVTGETDVTDYKGLSIDWTPLNRAGMPTSVAAMSSGEMDSITAPADASHEALREALRNAAYDKLSRSDNDYVGVNAVYDGYFIAHHERGNEGMRYYRISYTKSPDDGGLLLGEPTEVRRVESWEAVTSGEQKEGETHMNADLKALLDAGKITEADIKAAAGEMQTPAGQAAEPSALEAACGEMFGGKTGDELISAVKAAYEAEVKQKAAAFADKIDGIIKSKVSGEMAQSLVKKMVHIQDGATDAEITGEIDKVLADETVKGILAKAHIDTVPPVATGEQDAGADMFETQMAAL